MNAREEHEQFTVDHYRRYFRHFDRTTLRSSYSDAAHLCDAIAADLLKQHTVRGKVTKHGQALADAVKAAGDAIWQLTEKVAP